MKVEFFIPVESHCVYSIPEEWDGSVPSFHTQSQEFFPEGWIPPKFLEVPAIQTGPKKRP
jgi:hypothetical protein